MSNRAVTLDDKYAADDGRIFLNGTQALIRMALMQARRDKTAGLKTQGFITGYRGSPLGTIDMELTRAQRFLEQNEIHFVPGVNEDLAATSLWGTQQIHLNDKPAIDGVFGIWYGKGPGVDRTGDAFRHANLAGSSAHGGVLALAGDDHTCKSSTTSHQSEYALMDAMIPVLTPSTIQEMVAFGLHGWAMSRFTGGWAAMKVTAELTDRSVSMPASLGTIQPVTPSGFAMPDGGLSIRWPDTPQEQEARLHLYKVPAARAYVRANGLDRVTLGSAHARFGIVTAGKAFLDLRQALFDLGIDDTLAAELGITIYKLGVTWPVEPEGVRAFAVGLSEIFVVEEKRPLIEGQIKDILYALPGDLRPRVTGKQDETGAPLLKSHDELLPSEIARALAARLTAHSVPSERFKPLAAPPVSKGADAIPKRSAYFCSGCPHNSSTKVPDGSRALAGIGCHWMSQGMDRNTATYSHMGGEGANWIGMAPFVPTEHIFQNIGDGTYFHSGLLAIRAAIAANVNITYKILFNDAVAMTGGQPHDGQLTPQAIAWQLYGEGVKRIAVLSDNPDRYFKGAFPPGVTIDDRDELDRIQRELRQLSGVTGLIFDQTCAAEKRRRRKRGKMDDPARFVVINEQVCEGCGDCSAQSNCLSVVPVETEFGTKRQIEQSSCNKDFSCLKGFCPSFVTVEGARLRKPAKVSLADDTPLPALPEPQIPALARPYALLVTGVGGTGVITIGGILGMAAHLEGKAASIMDQTGMAQKGGAVTSHIVIAMNDEGIRAARIGGGAADAMLGCDALVAAGADAIGTLEKGRSRAVLNTHETITGGFTRNPEERVPLISLIGAVKAACGPERVDVLDATDLATRLLGDAIGANLLILGYAWQKGLVPAGREAIEQAIRLNGASVGMNLAAFAWGRRAAIDPASVEAAAKPKGEISNAFAHRRLSEDVDALIRNREAQLTAFQDAAYAARYRVLVDRVRQAESRAAPGGVKLTEAVARYFYKLMAYKDEYEVARLHTNGAFAAQLAERFEDGYRLKFHLAPPMIAARDSITGHLKKRAFGGWMLMAFKILAKLKGLRGTPYDIFGYTAERRAERHLIEDYENAVSELIEGLNHANHALAVQIASLPERIRGYGHVKEKAMAQAKSDRERLIGLFRAPAKRPVAAE